jgi:hypothetical protein
MAVHPHCAAHRLGDHVEGQIVRVRALRREALDLGEDQSRIERAQPRKVEAEACEGARRHVLDQDIGLADHPPQQRLTFLALEVAGHAALVEVVVDEIGRIGVGAIAQSPSPRLAAMGLLHLNDVSPKPGQRLGAGRSRLELGEVEHLDPLERRLGSSRDLWMRYLFLHGDPPNIEPRQLPQRRFDVTLDQLCQVNSCALRADPCEITTLTSAGPRKLIASSRAPRRSFGSSTMTPLPPKASITRS